MFGKIKQVLGIGTVKVELSIPAQIEKHSGTVSGSVKLTARSDQEVTRLHVKLIEIYETGRGEEKSSKEFDLGEATIAQQLAMHKGDEKEVAFTLHYELIKSNNDVLKDHGGALKTLGKMGAFASNEKSEYFVDVIADVKGAALDPSDRKPIRLIE
jgi:hypothetical protein